MASFTIQFTPRLLTFAFAVFLSAAATIGSADATPSFGRGIVGAAAFAAPKQQRRYKQSPSSGGGRKRKNIGSNQNWYSKRKAGVKVSSKGPKPPKWEREGDDLYVDYNNRNDEYDDASKGIVGNKNISDEEARKILHSLEGKPARMPSASDATKLKLRSDDSLTTAADEKPFLWGGLSVGPVWKSRLLRAGLPEPTPIQVASYTALSNKKNQTSINGNAVIAAATGSGKSLAYLLPFLTSIDTNNSKKKQKSHRQNKRDETIKNSIATSALGRIWIVTPTIELAYQLQRTVDNVIVGKNSEASSSKVLHVVEYNRGAVQSRTIDSDESSSFSASYPILTDIVHRYYNDDSSISQEPTFMAGTPKLFVQLRKEIKKVLSSTTRVDANLRFERQRHARRMRESSEGIRRDETGDDDEEDQAGTEEQILYRRVALALRGNLKTLILDEVDRLLQTTTAMTRREHRTTRPLAQELLEALVWESRAQPPPGPGRYRGDPSSSTSKLQIVCASATIGRMLRRQLMYIVKAPSMDKAAALVTADVRTKKNAEQRKASLLPSNLRHSYRLVSGADTKDEAAGLVLNALVSTLQTQDPPAPSLIFPGAVGVEAVGDHLSELGFRDVRGLSSLRSDGSGADGSSVSSTPLDAPVYVVKERLARGLDLPEVRRVVLVGVPRNAAAYAHLAGRTARQNTPGDCTVLCKPSETRRLVSIAETLGLQSWTCLDANVDAAAVATATVSADGRETTELASGKTPSTLQDAATSGGTWDLRGMTKTAIKSKKVSELRGFLESNGVATKGLLKNSLVDAVLQLKTAPRCSDRSDGFAVT